MTDAWKELATIQADGACDTMEILEEYVADGLGAPFGIVLCNAVKQEKCPVTHRVLTTFIPNKTDLLKEAALARALCDRKFSSQELKFLRKAVNLKAIELAELLGISAEHLSRCENGDRVLSNAAEKLFRVIILKRRYDRLEVADKIIEKLSDANIDPNKIRPLRDMLSYYRECVKDLEKAIFESRVQSVFDFNDKLTFSFGLWPLSIEGEKRVDDDQWRRRNLPEAA